MKKRKKKHGFKKTSSSLLLSPDVSQRQANGNTRAMTGLPPDCILRFASERLPQATLRSLWAWITITIFSSLFVLIPCFSMFLILSTLYNPKRYIIFSLFWSLLAVLPHQPSPGFRMWFCKYFITYWVELFEFRIVMDGQQIPWYIMSAFNRHLISHPTSHISHLTPTSSCNTSVYIYIY